MKVVKEITRRSHPNIVIIFPLKGKKKFKSEKKLMNKIHSGLDCDYCGVKLIKPRESKYLEKGEEDKFTNKVD